MAEWLRNHPYAWIHFKGGGFLCGGSPSLARNWEFYDQ
jgi:hypothetical protein